MKCGFGMPSLIIRVFSFYSRSWSDESKLSRPVPSYKKEMPKINLAFRSAFTTFAAKFETLHY